MEFDQAAQRLAKDQSKLRQRRPQVVSAKAKREAQLRKQQQERLAAEKKRQEREHIFLTDYFRQCERRLGVRSLSPESGSSLQLKPTSIYGEGDKIALPPSVLEFFTTSGHDMNGGGGPWTFRIGVLNPNYSFPASPLLQIMKIPDEDEEEEEDEDGASSNEAYLDELRHKYLSYTHGTVVEFTQEEGHVGLPEPIAAALLSADNIPVTRTTDPAKQGGDDSSAMDVEDEKTPGHLAWGAFDLPDMLVEISLVQLPKGKACRLVPTREAIHNGFYNLQDIKLVLEQSLIRTRATLSVGDLVHTWHRGTKFDLKVSEVTPATYNAVTCINTDIEVEFGEHEKEDEQHSQLSRTESGGHVLSSGAPVASERTSQSAPAVVLKPEPPAEQTEGICTVQIRVDGAYSRRRFDTRHATISDLFAFAASAEGGGQNFRLVTTFPRRVFTLDRDNRSTTLAEAGMQSQEMFMLERI